LRGDGGVVARDLIHADNNAISIGNWDRAFTHCGGQCSYRDSHAVGKGA